jgi:hypothetical protein
MWPIVLVYCFLSLMIYASLVVLRLLPQIIAGMAFQFVTLFVVVRIIDAINLVETAATYCFNFVTNGITYFFSNFWTILGVTLGAVVVASLAWMIIPSVIKRAKRQMRRYYNRRTMYLLDHEG